MASIEELLEKRKQIDAQIRREKTLQSQREKKNDTRRKILVGAFIMENKDQYKTLVESKAFNHFITRENDRKLFGLEVKPSENKKTDKTKKTVENIPSATTEGNQDL